jgi:uncharacterized protein YndB with AHSA1/START domain
MTAEPLRLERHYNVPLARVFEIVTRADLLAQWWGPEGIVRSVGDLDFTATGPWNSTMINAEGTRYKVSGQVTKVDPPNLVAFTWGWHDDADQRGNESHVTISLTEDAGGTRFVLTHADLPNDEQVMRHNEGWTSSLRKLDAVVNG